LKPISKIEKDVL